MRRLAGVYGPKAKRKFFWRKEKFEKLLFEVFPHEAVDDKVDGGVEHERQLQWKKRILKDQHIVLCAFSF